MPRKMIFNFKWHHAFSKVKTGGGRRNANAKAMPTLKHWAAPVPMNDCLGWVGGKWVVWNTPSAPRKRKKGVENTTVRYRLSDQQRSTTAKQPGTL